MFVACTVSLNLPHSLAEPPTSWKYCWAILRCSLWKSRMRHCQGIWRPELKMCHGLWNTAQDPHFPLCEAVHQTKNNTCRSLLQAPSSADNPIQMYWPPLSNVLTTSFRCTDHPFQMYWPPLSDVLTTPFGCRQMNWPHPSDVLTCPDPPFLMYWQMYWPSFQMYWPLSVLTTPFRCRCTDHPLLMYWQMYWPPLSDVLTTPSGCRQRYWPPPSDVLTSVLTTPFWCTDNFTDHPLQMYWQIYWPPPSDVLTTPFWCTDHPLHMYSCCMVAQATGPHSLSHVLHSAHQYSPIPVPGPEQHWPHPSGCTPVAWWAPSPWSGCTLQECHLHTNTRYTHCASPTRCRHPKQHAPQWCW